jgi:hypothetical protein
MTTHKAKVTSNRVDIMKRLNLPFVIHNANIMYRGSLFGYKTLVSLLVAEGEKLNKI